jgi:Glutathione-dependent formaldehyde-activating enzyme
MTGGCQCGAIRYEIASFLLLLYSCNCTDCQRQTGSAFALNMPVRSGDFRILQGEPNGWHHTSPNGTPVIPLDRSGRLTGRATGLAAIRSRSDGAPCD